jgi:2,3,4,5-tetrahydropyridine-2,6-dicarboxylate N-succinyltransferase
MLPSEIEQLFDSPPPQYTEEHRRTFDAFKAALNRGEVRAAEPDDASKTGWRINAWVKKGILLGFRMGKLVDMSVDRERQPFFDKDTYPTKAVNLASQVRIVPGGSSIRDASYVGRGVTCMPPMFINAGAYVDDGTMVDSHALIGSCAQVGRNCHISAGAQIGGVLEPIGAMPVIIEDEVMVGGNCGVYEGVVVKRRAVLGSGVILNGSTAVYDLVREQIYTATDGCPLMIPEEAVVVPGSRAISHPVGQRWNLSLYTPIIVKYRDVKTNERVQLESLFR